MTMIADTNYNIFANDVHAYVKTAILRGQSIVPEKFEYYYFSQIDAYYVKVVSIYLEFCFKNSVKKCSFCKRYFTFI